MLHVLGSINIDLVATVDRLPHPGETVPGVDFRVLPGGKGANQALAAARAGAPVAMAGAVGDDAFAAPALAGLAAAGVDLSRVRRVAAPTGTAIILVDRAGENVIAVVAGANAAVGATDADALALGPGDVLLMQLEIPRTTVERAARRARQLGATVVLNAAPADAGALAFLEAVDVLVTNESECLALAAGAGLPATDAGAACAALAGACGLDVVTTLGDAGVVGVAGGRDLRAPALGVDVVDTVGAGDAFCGYLAAALEAGRRVDEDSLTRAGAAASLACTRPGAQAALPDAAAVERARFM